MSAGNWTTAKLDCTWIGRCHVCWAENVSVVEFWSTEKKDADEDDGAHTSVCRTCIARAYSTLQAKMEDPPKDMAKQILEFFSDRRGFDGGFWSDCDQEARDEIMRELRELVGPGGDDQKAKTKKRKVEELDRKAESQPLMDFVSGTLAALPKGKATALLKSMAQLAWTELAKSDHSAKRLKADGAALLREAGVKMDQ